MEMHTPDLADRLRNALHAARGNPRIRERLRELVDDRSWLQPILRDLGPNHGVVIDLLRVTDRDLEFRDLPLS
jgi:hypothetical protein